MAKEKNKHGQGEWSFSQRNTDGLWTARKMFGRKADGKPNIVAFYGKTRTEVKEKAAAYKEQFDFDEDEVDADDSEGVEIDKE